MTKNNLFISYAQNNEDVILNRVFKNVDKGFYIDVGAQHPEIDSVTKSFYDKGWHGINIEPSREWYELLEEQRKRDVNLDSIITDKPSEEIIFYEIINSGLSTIIEDIANQHKKDGWEVIEKKIQSKTLDQVCEENAIEKIHFLKIDVEGAEKKVLEGFSFQVRPWIVVVESTVPLGTTDSSGDWSELLSDFDYQQVYFDGLNRYYVDNAMPELFDYFNSPANPNDNFVSSKYYKLDKDFNNLNDIHQRLDSNYHNLNDIHQKLDSKYHNLDEEYHNLDEEYHHLNERYHEVLADTIETNKKLSILQQKFEKHQDEYSALSEYVNSLHRSSYWKYTSYLRDLGKLKSKFQRTSGDESDIVKNEKSKNNESNEIRLPKHKNESRENLILKAFCSKFLKNKS